MREWSNLTGFIATHKCLFSNGKVNMDTWHYRLIFILDLTNMNLRKLCTLFCLLNFVSSCMMFFLALRLYWWYGYWRYARELSTKSVIFVQGLINIGCFFSELTILQSRLHTNTHTNDNVSFLFTQSEMITQRRKIWTNQLNWFPPWDWDLLDKVILSCYSRNFHSLLKPTFHYRFQESSSLNLMNPIHIIQSYFIRLKGLPVTGREGPKGCETSRLPHFL
jgi:hypothetical protein